MNARTSRAFRGPTAFRAWLEKHRSDTLELLVRCYKAHASAKRLTYRQALFSVRFTPRKPKSAWSTVNIKRFGELQAEGRVHAAGLAAFEVRVKSRYSFETKPVALAPSYLKAFRANRSAWQFFESQPPWYRRTAAFWVMSAKRPETRASRLRVLVARSEANEGIPPLKRPTRS